jgi:hypothetical protein
MKVVSILRRPSVKVLWFLKCYQFPGDRMLCQNVRRMAFGRTGVVFCYPICRAVAVAVADSCEEIDVVTPRRWL